MGTSKVRLSVTGGETYLVVVDGYSAGKTGDFNLAVSCVPSAGYYHFPYYSPNYYPYDFMSYFWYSSQYYSPNFYPYDSPSYSSYSSPFYSPSSTSSATEYYSPSSTSSAAAHYSTSGN